MCQAPPCDGVDREEIRNLTDLYDEGLLAQNIELTLLPNHIVSAPQIDRRPPIYFPKPNPTPSNRLDFIVDATNRLKYKSAQPLGELPWYEPILSYI